LCKIDNKLKRIFYKSKEKYLAIILSNYLAIILEINQMIS